MNFEKRAVIHQSGVPTSDKYCLVLFEDGMMHIAFYNNKWILVHDYMTSTDNVKAWCYIEDLFDAPKNVDIRMYIDESESCI